MAQHHQIADVVWYFVRQHRQRSDHAQTHVGQESRGDQDAVAKRMHAVAGQHGPTARAQTMVVVRVAVSMVVGVVAMAGPSRAVIALACIPLVAVQAQQQGRRHLAPGHG